MNLSSNGNEVYKSLPVHDDAEISSRRDEDCPSKEEYTYSKRDILYQAFASLVAYSLVIHAGINLALSTVLHPQLEITKDQASWIASLGAIGTPVGSLSVGFLMDRIGRQKTLLVTSAVTMMAWSILCLLPSEFDIRFIYLARFFEGLGSGMTSISIVYVAETTNKYWRPLFLSINSIAISGGILLTTTLGVVLPWRTFAVFCLFMITASALICVTLPESPFWLIQNHSERAKKALSRFVTNPESFEAEWKALEPKRTQITKKKQKMFTYDKTVTRPLGVVLTLITLQQFVGIYPTIFYALELFQKIHGGSLQTAQNTSTRPPINFQEIDTTPLFWTEAPDVFNSSAFKSETSYTHSSELTNAFKSETNLTPSSELNNAFKNERNYTTNFTPKPSLNPIKSKLDLNSPAVLALMGLGLVRFVASISMTALSKRFGVRKLLIFSSLGVGISSAFFSAYQAGWCSQSSDTVSFVIILSFITFGSLGLLVIPWTLIGELLPIEFRGVGQGITVAYAYVLMFFIVKFYPFLEDELGTSVIFGSFSFTAFLTVAFVYFFVPETLGKTMDEIQMFFQKR